MTGLWRQARVGAEGGALSAVAVVASLFALGWTVGPPTDSGDGIGMGAALGLGALLLGVLAAAFGAGAMMAFALVRQRRPDATWNIQAAFMVALLVFYAALSLAAGQVDFDKDEISPFVAAPLFVVAWNPWLAAPLWAWIGSLAVKPRKPRGD